MLMEMCMKESGRMIKPMDTVSSQIQPMLDTKAIGQMTSNMVKELRLGIITLLNTLVSFTKVRSKEKGDLNGKMEVIMREISFQDSLKDLESTISLIQTKSIKANSEMETWKAEALKYGMMEEDTKETSKMERKTVKANTNGQTGINTQDHGNKENNMVLEYGLVKLMVGLKDKVNGSMVKDRGGSLGWRLNHSHHQTKMDLDFDY